LILKLKSVDGGLYALCCRFVICEIAGRELITPTRNAKPPSSQTANVKKASYIWQYMTKNNLAKEQYFELQDYRHI